MRGCLYVCVYIKTFVPPDQQLLPVVTRLAFYVSSFGFFGLLQDFPKGLVKDDTAYICILNKYGPVCVEPQSWPPLHVAVPPEVRP